jgi:nitrile hydratase accessory protein
LQRTQEEAMTADSGVQLGQIPNLPRNREGPYFDEPWQLTAFGIVVTLYRKGLFTWPEWVRYLSAEIALGNTFDVEDVNGIYYRQWLAALEKIVIDKNLSTSAELVERKEQWRFADEHRGFGQPLVLGGADHHHDHDDHTHDH